MIKMEDKFVKDTTKEDHYVKIAIGFKIIYNQNQYMAYTEMPKKKREIPLDIYIGKVSRLKGNYLIFKCETESEKNQVFGLFKKVFAGEQVEEIEMMDYSNVEKMSIVSFDYFDEKVDQYPNYFTLPEKEDDISAEIPIPKFFKKKGSKIKETSTEEIQFVGNNNEVLESNVEEVTPNPEVVETVTEPMNQTFEMNPVELQEVIADGKIGENVVPTGEVIAPVQDMNPVETVVPKEEVVIPTQVQDMNQAPVETVVPKEEVVIPTQVQDVNQASVETVIPKEEAVILPVQTINQVPIENIPVQPIMPDQMGIATAAEKVYGPAPLDSNTVADMNDEVKVTQVMEGGKQKKNQKNKKRAHATIIVLMIITILLIISVIVAYATGFIPKKEKEKPAPVPTPQTGNLVCTYEGVSAEYEGTDVNSTVTMVYDITSKNILTSKEETIHTMNDATEYQERKASIIIFSQELRNTDGQKYTFRYDDEHNLYRYLIERNYGKATDSEKDETWKSTFDEANEYYLNKGYTCNGQKKEPTVNLTSTTGSSTVDYNGWIVTYQKAILSEDKNNLEVTLEVKNNGTEKRTLNGEFKLFDSETKVLKTTPFTQDIEAGASVSVIVTVTSETTLEEAIAYEIELFR